MKPQLNSRSSRARLWAQQTLALICPTRGAHTFPRAPRPQGVAPTPAAAQGDPQHPLEILAPASLCSGWR